MKHGVSELSDSVLAELARQALAQSAERLGVDACELARGLADGRIAELILTLRRARSWAYLSDLDRIERLLSDLDLETAEAPAATPAVDPGRSVAEGGDGVAALEGR